MVVKAVVVHGVGKKECVVDKAQSGLKEGVMETLAELIDMSVRRNQNELLK